MEGTQVDTCFPYLKEKCKTQSFIDKFSTYLMNVNAREGSIKPWLLKL
jgi:hypothetical protein